MPPSPLIKNNVTVTGNPNASRTIVFAHGFGTDQTAWAKVSAPFLANFQVVLFDNAGAGKSDPKSFVQHRYLNLHGYAEDLLDICTTLRIENAILVGHSVGGMICLLAAIKNPKLAAKLVMIGASPRYLDDENYRGGFTEKDLSALYQYLMEDYDKWSDKFAALAMANPEQPQLAKYIAATIKSIPNDRTLTVLCSIFQSDHRSDLDKLDKPTLLIQTQEDIAVPAEAADYLHRHIRNSRLKTINATGHLPHISAPDEVIAAMRDFILE